MVLEEDQEGIRDNVQQVLMLHLLLQEEEYDMATVSQVIYRASILLLYSLG